MVVVGPMVCEEIMSIGAGRVIRWSATGKTASSSARLEVSIIVVSKLESGCQ